MNDLDAGKELDVLLENYADSLVGTGLYAQGSVFGTVETKARSFRDAHGCHAGRLLE